MAGEPNQVKWIGIRPTDPAVNIPVDIKVFTAGIYPLEPVTQQIFQTEPGKWAATRGGVSRSQITAWNSVGNGWITIYTVTSGKTLFITNGFIGMRGTGAHYGRLVICSSGTTGFQTILTITCAANTAPNLSIAYPMPIVAPSGYLIRIESDTDNTLGGFCGWEE